jgi:hypothetical protein
MGRREFDGEIGKWDRDLSPRNSIWREVAHGLRSEREHFKDSFTQLLRQLGQRDGFKPGGQVPPFEKFWDEHKYTVAQSIVRGVSRDIGQSDIVDLCVRQGINGLLDNKCIRLAVSSMTSLMYSHFYNEGHPAKVRRSDAADIRHATAASVAEVFVTHDRAFFKRLSAVPISDFKIIYLDDFLTHLRQS